MTPETGDKAKILIVDDDERSAFAAATILEELGEILVIARSGEEALRHLLREDFAVILLDVSMPGMDGYETAALVRGRRRTRHVPIVFLTAVSRDEAHLFRAYSAGAVDVVFKPVDPFILRSKVSVLVDLHRKNAEIRLQAEVRHRLQEENFRVRTEKLLAERALRRSQERQDAILGTLPVVVHSRVVEPPFPPLFVSDNVERLTGFAAERFVDEPGFGASRIHPEDVERVFMRLGLAARTGSYECEYRWLCADGHYRTFLDQGVVAPEEPGKPREIFGTMVDVTERRQLEQQLGQAQKMEAVGQLTGGIAHDFNNLLTVILGNLDLIARRVAPDAPYARHLAAMRHAAERGQGLTRQLLAFSRRQHLNPETLDVNALVRGFESLIRRAVGEAVVVETALPADSATCYVDGAQLETALLNLAVNARDAMPDGGRLTIATARVEEDRRLRARVAEAGPGPWLLLTLADTGFGMSPEVAERAFEPFFTTKDVGKGSGLGLSQVYGFVRQSGGWITLDSTPGEGTELRIYLPLSSEPITARTVDGVASLPVASRHSERVLLVEDDPNVLALEVEMLSGLGYQVQTASDAAGALAILGRGDPVDLVFTDVVMPGGTTGVQLGREAQRLRPGIRVLLTSGYTGEALSKHRHAEAALPLIAKPFSQADLAARLRDVLDAPPGT